VAWGKFIKIGLLFFDEKMVKKKASAKKSAKKKSSGKKAKIKKRPVPGKVITPGGLTKKYSDTMKIAGDREIAYDFALKVHEKFESLIKAIIHFGSGARAKSKPNSDVDIIIVIDDVSIIWDEELIAWYREELRELVLKNPYVKKLHLNTIKLSTWWSDLMKGEPVLINVIRYGSALIDYGGFFEPLKILLNQGQIRSTPEAIYMLLERAPRQMTRGKQALLSSVDGIYWSMVDSAHALLISVGITPPSPELIPEILMEAFVKPGRLDKKFVYDYDEIHTTAKEIIHQKLTNISGKEVDKMFEKADAFLKEMLRLTKEEIKKEDLEKS